MSNVLTLDGLTPDRLTAVLPRKGHAPRGRIEQVAIESSRTTLISAIARLRLEWSPDADGRLPSRLFLKMSRPDQNAELAAVVLKEVAFYDTVAPLLPPGIVPSCYDAVRDPGSTAFHLLLEDLAETHFVTAVDSLRLIDWDAQRLDLAATDLAYMMALHWYPERRRRVEVPLLRRYHEALTSHGVTGYSFEALWEDYRLSVIWRLAVPVWQSSVKLGPWVWWSHLERIFMAFDDLRCEELLE